MLGDVRRIVTGHDDANEPIIVSDGPPERTLERPAYGDRKQYKGMKFHEIWHTLSVPAPLDRRSGEPEEPQRMQKPPKGGTRVRVVDYPNRDKPTVLHRRATLDYIFVVEGQMYLLIGDGKETLVQAGDVMVNRGANYSFWNRFPETCRIVVVAVDGEYAGDLEGHGEYDERKGVLPVS